MKKLPNICERYDRIIEYFEVQNRINERDDFVRECMVRDQDKILDVVKKYEIIQIGKPLEELVK